MPIPYGSNRVTTVSAELAEAFKTGDQLIVIQDTGALLHIEKHVADIASEAVTKAQHAFTKINSVTDQQITQFYKTFAENLADDQKFGPIAEANAKDVTQAKARGRSTTRLELSQQMRSDMIAGLQVWQNAATERQKVVETYQHDGWKIEQIRSGLGIVGFIFEGRPNVFADAAGVLRSGNTVVFRIGSDALGTAEAIMAHAVEPALETSGLPKGALSLVASAARSAGYALFSDQRLSLAVARGSGPAVSQLGAVARQSGTAVSLHGTGGAWMLADTHADAQRFANVVTNSLDRKVCNTLNTCAIISERAKELVPVLLKSLRSAAEERNTNPKLHIEEKSAQRLKELIEPEWFEKVAISRADGEITEPQTEILATEALSTEWEWENSPEITLLLVDSIEEFAELYNTYSPRFVASLISENREAHHKFFTALDAPFIGDGFTRWVDGQYAFNRPELGLSNWSYGRLFGRGAVLSGDSVYTLRSKVTQTETTLRR